MIILITIIYGVIKISEIDELIFMLEGKSFELSFVDADSLQVKKEGNYGSHFR